MVMGVMRRRGKCVITDQVENPVGDCGQWLSDRSASQKLDCALSAASAAAEASEPEKATNFRPKIPNELDLHGEIPRCFGSNPD